MSREEKERNEQIYKDWVAGKPMWKIGEEHGISAPTVHGIIKRYRETTNLDDRKNFIEREVAMLDEIRQLGLEVARSKSAPATVGGELIRDEDGKVVRDHSGRLAGARTAAEAGRELRKMLGLDAATKQQVETAVRYILEGVPPEEDV